CSRFSAAPRASATSRSSLFGSPVFMPYCAPSLGAMQRVSLGRHDEVVLVQALYFLGLPGDTGPAPSKADVGMVAFAFRQLADLGDEIHRFLEILELEAAFDAAPLVLKRPPGRLRQIDFRLGFGQRRDSA